METGQNGWTTRTESFAEMHSNRDNFYLTARLEAYKNDTLIFEKTLATPYPATVFKRGEI